MPTYTYETCPTNAGTPPRRFEVIQKMSDDAFTTDPETGEPVRRVISGGQGYRQKGMRRSAKVDKTSPAATACGCATGRGHNHHH
jgi:predicted nucleic acid-binding Zn ribbon protein